MPGNRSSRSAVLLVGAHPSAYAAFRDLPWDSEGLARPRRRREPLLRRFTARSIPMKAMNAKGAGLLVVALLFPGCVSLPPVVHVEHKGDQQAVVRRLDAIEQRLDRIEPRLDEELRRELRRISADLEEIRRENARASSSPAE
jgi:hypothetical protein